MKHKEENPKKKERSLISLLFSISLNFLSNIGMLSLYNFKQKIKQKIENLEESVYLKIYGRLLGKTKYGKNQIERRIRESLNRYSLNIYTDSNKIKRIIKFGKEYLGSERMDEICTEICENFLKKEKDFLAQEIGENCLGTEKMREIALRRVSEYMNTRSYMNRLKRYRIFEWIKYLDKETVYEISKKIIMEYLINYPEESILIPEKIGYVVKYNRVGISIPRISDFIEKLLEKLEKERVKSIIDEAIEKLKERQEVERAALLAYWFYRDRADQSLIKDAIRKFRSSEKYLLAIWYADKLLRDREESKKEIDSILDEIEKKYKETSRFSELMKEIEEARELDFDSRKEFGSLTNFLVWL